MEDKDWQVITLQAMGMVGLGAFQFREIPGGPTILSPDQIRLFHMSGFDMQLLEQQQDQLRARAGVPPVLEILEMIKAQEKAEEEAEKEDAAAAAAAS